MTKVVVVVTTAWSYKTYNAPFKSSPATYQHPVFYRPIPFLSPNQLVKIFSLARVTESPLFRQKGQNSRSYGSTKFQVDDLAATDSKICVGHIDNGF